MLVGRADELAALRALLAVGRLVTVVGVGGVGKTALALAAAGDAPVCELARVERGEDVAAAVARATGFPTWDSALVGLAGLERTVVLDNCEHLLDAAAEVAERLAAACPGVRVLATSREPLDVSGERVLPLAPLAVPDRDEPAGVADSPAVALLLARARDLGIELVADGAVAELCRRLDGLPLAIELAAARTPTLSPAEIVTHLRDRLDLLTRTRERGPARHRSLDATISWSHGRLPVPTARFFDRLGVFAGRFTIEQAHAVAGESGEDLLQVVGHLDLLVTQSMVTVRRQEGRSWYGLLDTLRAFARARLAERGELAAVQDRWLDALVGTARDMQRALEDNAPDAWRALHTVQADLRAAARRCIDRDDRPDRVIVLLRPLALTVHSAPALPLAELAEAALARWFDAGGPRRAVDRGRRGRADPSRPGATEAPVRSRPPGAAYERRPGTGQAEAAPASGAADAAALAAFARLALHQLGEAAALAGRALATASDPFAGMLARRTLAVCDLTGGRPDRALRWADEMLALAEAEHQPGWAVEVAALRAVVLAALDRTDDAIEQARTAQEQAVSLGNPTLEAWAGLQCACLLALRDPAAAGTDLENLVDRSRRAGYPLGEGAACRALGGTAVVTGTWQSAAAWLGRALDVFVRIGHTIQIRVTLRWVAALASAGGRPAPAAALRRVAGDVRAPVTEILDRAWLDGLLAAVVPDARALPLPEAVALARRELAVAAGPSADRRAAPGPGSRTAAAPRAAATDVRHGHADAPPLLPAPAVAEPAAARLTLEGTVWTAAYAGRTVRLPHAKGLADLAALLARPGREVHCTELAGAAVDQPDTGGPSGFNSRHI